MRDRSLQVAAAALFGAALLAAVMPPTQAVAQIAPAQADSAAAYFRMQFGDGEVTSLSDGSSNAYLVATHDKLVLIDTGAGTLLGPGAGALVDSLRAAGRQPEQIDEILITQVDPGHVGGLLASRKPVFPNATVRISRADAVHWLDKSSAAAVPVASRQQFASVAAAFKPYIAAGRLSTFDGATELASGIRALPGTGSAATRTLYLAASDGAKILFCGDAAHTPAGVSRNRSTAVRIQWGDAADGSLAKRRSPLAEAAAQGYWVAGNRLPFPGIGHVRAAGSGFEFVPVAQPRN